MEIPLRVFDPPEYVKGPNSVSISRIVILAAFVLSISSVPSIADPPAFVQGEILVGFRGRIASLDLPVGRIVATQARLNISRVKLRRGVSVAQAITSLRNQPNVAYAEPNFIRNITTTPNDTRYSEQFALTKTETDKAWDLWQPQGAAVIAILDTGVQTSHPDLQNVILRDGAGVAIAKNVQTGALTAEDDHGHGTHCAGIAAAHINNAAGVAGVAGWNPTVTNYADWVRVMPVKVLNSSGSGTDAHVVDGIVWAADNGANVISMSFGGAGDAATINTAIQYAWSKGVVVVAAAGNHGSDTPFYPAACDNTIAVASTNITDTLSSWSGYGSWVDTAAPGESILSTYPGNSYTTASGTSMAAPFVAGEAALIKAHNPALSNSQIVNLITTNFDAYTPYSGHTINGGRVNVKRALDAAAPVPFALTPSATTVTVETTISVNWTAPTGRPATDWVAIFKVGADNRQYGSWKYTGGAATGTFTLNAPSEAGDYEFRYLLNNGFIDAARSAKISVQTVVPQNYTVSASPAAVNPGEFITVSWTAPAGRPATDWIGMYTVGTPNSAYGWWAYTNGQSTGVFSVKAPIEGGDYEFRYLLNNGFTDSARSGTVRVNGAATTYSLTPSATSVKAGEALSVSWTAPSGRPTTDWIGLFRVGDSNAQYGWWVYTAGATSGTANLTAPLQTGTYEFRYLLNNGFTDVVRSAPVAVTP